MACFLLTADTRGNGAQIAATLGLKLHRLKRGSESALKRAFVVARDAETVVAIGNGANDAGMLDAAALGIIALQDEGAAISAWRAADIAAPGICAALDLLLEPGRLIATFRV
jgi:soluble P-type ATPase